MATANLTIRKIDPAVKERLRVRAAQHGRSMEEEARRILSDACPPAEAPKSLGELALDLFGHEGGVELDLPTRQPLREPPDFSEHG
ncbi:MAG: plasmid stabilization protein [Parvibaculaceae bacterium]